MARPLYGSSNTGQMQSSVNGQWVDYNSPEAVAQRQTRQQAAQQQQQQVQQGQRQTIGEFMNTADPFASQRSQYATRLSDLMGGGSASPGAPAPAGGPQVTALSGFMRPVGAVPSQITASTTAPAMQPGAAKSPTFSAPQGRAFEPNIDTQSNPFFKASMEAGQEAAKRRLAQMGMGTSGNAALELQKAAQANLAGDYFRMADLTEGARRFDTQQGSENYFRAAGLGEGARQFDKQQGSGDYFRLADLLGRFSGANADPSAGANAGMAAWNQLESTRRFENQNTPNQFWAGQQINKKPEPLSLGSLSSYRGF